MRIPPRRIQSYLTLLLAGVSRCYQSDVAQHYLHYHNTTTCVSCHLSHRTQSSRLLMNGPSVIFRIGSTRAFCRFPCHFCWSASQLPSKCSSISLLIVSYRPQNSMATLVCCTSTALHNSPTLRNTTWSSSQSTTMPSSVLSSCYGSQKKILPSSVLCIFRRLEADRSSFKSASMDCVLFCCTSFSSVSVGTSPIAMLSTT